jgi:exopolysaccharide biosynthesis polyprenyl glycosylphosphotransferase
MHGWNRVLKRGLDIVVASLALAIFSPLLLLAAVSVRFSSPGPILYRQPRMGLDGRIFYMAKFRTMRQDAEADTGPVWCRPDDPRRTKIGRFLRRFSIDELPQLFHVLKGEMSLVGPRPERPEFIDQFKNQVPKYMLRHQMKAGMTGWAQINGFRGNTSLEGRIKHDIEYIQNWTLYFDLKILARTLWHVVRDVNAY